MPKYITQEDVFQILADLNDPFGAKVRTTEAMRRIKALSAADVVEVRHGHWIEKNGKYICSECGELCKQTAIGKPRWNYCPSCGAKMDGGQEE